MIFAYKIPYSYILYNKHCNLVIKTNNNINHKMYKNISFLINVPNKIMNKVKMKYDWRIGNMRKNYINNTYYDYKCFIKLLK